MSFIFLIVVLGGVIGLGGILAGIGFGVMSRKKNQAIPTVLSEDERRHFLRQCDSVLSTFKGVGDRRPDDALDRAVEGLYPLLLKWREHLAHIPEIPVTAKDLPAQWTAWQGLLMRTLASEQKQASRAADGVEEVARTFSALQEEYGALLREVEQGQINDLVVEARVLQRLVDMDDRLKPVRDLERISS